MLDINRDINSLSNFKRHTPEFPSPPGVLLGCQLGRRGPHCGVYRTLARVVHGASGKPLCSHLGIDMPQHALAGR
jgi:hypothetical protein